MAQKSHYHRNREKRLSNYKSWLERNREYRRQYGRDLYQRNPAHFSAKTARREADKRQRMPVWANQADIDFFYECRPAGFHVDHIVPLRGENVSGLHVAENLQWLPASVNVAKGNRWEVA